MYKECVMVPSTLIHTLTPVTHKTKQTNKKNFNSKIVKVVQRVDLVRLKR